MARRPTVYDVAERAGVSIATVSFAFRQPERVRAQTREAVIRAADEIGYVPSASARGLAHGKTGAMGLYSFDLLIDAPQDSRSLRVPGEDEDAAEADVRAYPLYVDEVQRGFELECWRRGQALLLSGGAGLNADLVKDLAGRVDGLAVFPGPFPDEALDLVARRSPVVVFSRPEGSSGLFHVGVENRQAMRELIHHLVADHGVTGAGFVGALEAADYTERFVGFQQALDEHGLPVPSEPFEPADLGQGDQFAILSAAIASGRLPEALVCASDQIALSVLDLLAASGVSVPEDVIVTGFDGILAGRLSDPTLTTVRQPMEAMGRFAARVLVEADGQRWDEPHSRRFPARFVRRSSCGC